MTRKPKFKIHFFNKKGDLEATYYTNSYVPVYRVPVIPKLRLPTDPEPADAIDIEGQLDNHSPGGAA